MRSRIVPIAALAVLLGGVAAAQETQVPETETGREDRTARTRDSTVEEERVTLRERMERAMRLPRTTDEAREEGVPEEQVREVLRTGRERRIPAGDMEVILETENETIREGGDKDNFGAAVQTMKADGLRGRELAEAIHAEQIARGMKKPKGEGHGRGKGKDHRDHGGDDRDDDHDDDGDHGGGKGRGKGRSK